MSALTAARAMAEGIHRVLPDAETIIIPMADGGEGTTQALSDALGGEMVSVSCHDALGRPISVPSVEEAGTAVSKPRNLPTFGWQPARKLAIIETAAASGLELVAPAERNITTASSYGTGELVKAALDKGAKHIILGLGGSATNDAGAGLFRALGVRFLDIAGNELQPGGLALAELARIDVSGLDPRIADCKIEAACDVDNLLLGESGASAVFGPQKGATPEMVTILDAALANWAAVVKQTTGRDVTQIRGGGAAGGIGAALAAFTNARLRPGVDIVIDAVGLRDEISNADYVFTGEGKIDSQTQHGKTPWGVATVAAEFGVPCIAFAGKITPDAAELLGNETGFAAIVPIIRGITDLPTALASGPVNLADAAETTTRLLVAGLVAGKSVSHR